MNEGNGVLEAREYDYVNLGGTYAVMSRSKPVGKPAGRWTAMFFVPNEAEASRILAVCRDPSQKGLASLRAMETKGLLRGRAA